MSLKVTIIFIKDKCFIDFQAATSTYFL